MRPVFRNAVAAEFAGWPNGRISHKNLTITPVVSIRISRIEDLLTWGHSEKR